LTEPAPDPARQIERWPIFICYRRIDGGATASRIFDLLSGQRLTDPDGNEIELDPYLDVDVPGVADWKAHLRPFLERARALIVVCTPAACLRHEGQDWVHEEIEWWLTRRAEAPILIDPLGAGERYVPRAIARRWPNIQRISAIEAEWQGLDAAALEEKGAALRERILRTLLPSGAEVYRAELEAERRRSRTLRRLLVATAILTLATVGAAYYANQQRLAAQQEASRAFAALAEDELNRGNRARALALALQGLPDSLADDGDFPDTDAAGRALLRALGADGFASERLSGVPVALLGHDAGTPGHGAGLVTLGRGGLALPAPAGMATETVETDAGNPVRSLRFARSGGLVAVGLDDGTLMVRLGSGWLRRDAHGAAIWALAASADGTWLATGARDGIVKLWRVAEGGLTLGTAIDTGGRPVWALDIDADAMRLLTGHADGRVALWDARTGAPIQTLTQHARSVLSVRFGPDGAKVVSAAADRRVRIVDIATGRIDADIAHDRVVWVADFAGPGTVLSAAAGGGIRITDLRTGREIVTVATGVDDPRFAALDLEPAMRIAIAGREGTAEIWTLKRPEDLLATAQRLAEL